MYAREIIEASKSGLLELGLSLRQYRNDMVIGGGWAPFFICSNFFNHCGSMDIDLILKTTVMPRYDSIKKIVSDLGYTEENHFRYTKTITSPIDKKDYPIHVDFLCDKYDLGYLFKVQKDLEAFMFEGADIAFDFNFENEIETTLPDNGIAKTTIKTLDLPGSLILKGQALQGRNNQKDAYDIFALTHYNGGPEQAAEYFNKTFSEKHLSKEKHRFAMESIAVIKENFKDENHRGSFAVETFTDNKIRRNIAAAHLNRFLQELNLPIK